jgi:RNA polymerase primary sigma factor
MYLREMGTVELLSREGEIAIAKRIEAGREAMIAGLCESPLTFQAIIIWRDELNEGKIFLRDIIDLEATYAGPDAKNNMNPALLAGPLGPDGQPLAEAPWCRQRRRRHAAACRPCRAAGRAPGADAVPRRARRRRRRRRTSAEEPPPIPTSTTTSSKTRCRSPRSRPS